MKRRQAWCLIATHEDNTHILVTYNPNLRRRHISDFNRQNTVDARDFGRYRVVFELEDMLDYAKRNEDCRVLKFRDDLTQPVRTGTGLLD